MVHAIKARVTANGSTPSLMVISVRAHTSKGKDTELGSIPTSKPKRSSRKSICMGIDNTREMN